jgi:hypothetical protein
MTHAELATSESSDAVPSDGEILDGLQQRLDTLKDRIDAAVPEGYDIMALRASETDAKGEDVFDITSDERALVGLSGPFNVPGSQPLPAFSQPVVHEGDEDFADRIPGSAEDRIARTVLIVVAAIALAAAAYFGGLWWAERGAAGDAGALGAVVAAMTAF